MQFQDLQVRPPRITLDQKSIPIPTVGLGGFANGKL